VIAGDQVESNAAASAQIAECCEFCFCVLLKSRVVKFCRIAVDNHAICALNQRTQRQSTSRSAGLPEVEVTENKCAGSFHGREVETARCAGRCHRRKDRER